MKTDQDLERQLAGLDRRGYPALKALRGTYDFGAFTLSVDHVQGDPFAAPSALSVFVSHDVAEFPSALFDAPHRCRALEDWLLRRFEAQARAVSRVVGGSGKSGIISTDRPGPEVLARSACEVTSQGIIVRLHAGFPAHGRTVDGRGLAHMLLDLIPGCAGRALVCTAEALAGARAAVELADDQQALRAALDALGLVAFVADGAILPRASGVSARPLKGARPFEAPASLRVAIDLPHRGRTTGMGIPRGVTLIVGGGFHGKSTLLKALQEGVYDHIAGDGRELVVTDETAQKLRAEDGRAVRAVDIAPFIDNLPDGRDTHAFSTADASGSTSEAAAVSEALEAGARALLMDEDTSATNFMVRDRLMEAVVPQASEPITPFVERVRSLWKTRGVSSVIVVGSSGAFFPVADTIVQMERYEAHDITGRVRAVMAEHDLAATVDSAEVCQEPFPAPAGARRLKLSASARGGLKVRSQGLDGCSVGEGAADLRLVEQLVDAGQVAALAQMMRLVLEQGLLDGRRTVPEAVRAVWERLERDGWDALDAHGCPAAGFVLPRPQELAVCINRWRIERAR